MNVGLLVNFVGAVLLGFSSQFGLAAGLGGPIVWRGSFWWFINILGWCLLAIGFLIQLLKSKKMTC